MGENRKFLELLVKKAMLNESDLALLLAKYNNDAFDILNHLLINKVVDKHKLGRLWGDSLGISYVELQKVAFSEEVIKKLPEEFARKNKVIPIYQMGKAITVVTSKPQNGFLISKLEHVLNTQVSPLFCFEKDIVEAVDYYYSSYVVEESEKNDFKNVVAPVNTQGPISEEQKQYLVNNTKNIMEGVRAGKLPNSSDLKSISSFITDNITNKVDLGFCISQLRINDEYTYSHSINTAILASIMGKIHGFNTVVLKELTLSALLHDIGNMRVPKVILYKPGQLSQQENELKKRHTLLGYDIIKKMGLQEKVAEVALMHHETMNGKGYPQGLAAEQISLNTQIVSIVNLYDSLISDKPNKQAVSHHEAMNIMLIEGNGVFNFELLHKFVSIAYKNNISSLKKVFKASVFGDLI